MAEPQAEVSRDEFKKVETDVSNLTTGMDAILAHLGINNKPVSKESARDAEVVKAGPNKYTQNPEWEEMARTIVGEAVDHTEVAFAKGGGQLFTIVIKREFSNAPTDYLERYKEDRRTKEVGTEGESGVRVWCELVRDNLKKTRRVEV